MELKDKLFATFVKINKVSNIINLLKNNNVNENKISLYEIEDSNEVLLIFKFYYTRQSEIFNILPTKVFSINCKNNCFFTINAINKLIEVTSNLEKGNIKYSNIKIDFNLYKNKLILNKKN